MFSKYYNPTLLVLLIFISIVWLGLMWYNKRFSLLRAQNSEGFQQSSPYVLKQGAYIYDDFYVQIYDEIMQPMLRADDFLKPVLTATMPSHLHSLFLDIGCGTGAATFELCRTFGGVVGVDVSEPLIRHAHSPILDTH
jgi:SAM-dependent methyltransferase